MRMERSWRAALLATARPSQAHADARLLGVVDRGVEPEERERDAAMLETYGALLRGVNVGSRNRLSATDQVSLFAEAGCTEVRTYIQSGNVLFKAEAALAALLPDVIAARIAERFDYRVPVILRTGSQMAELARHNPFLAAGAPQGLLHVLFLPGEPSAAKVATLDPDRSPPDEFRVHGAEIYLLLPNNVAETKLSTTYFDARLATTCTGRNWRTVTTLRDLLQG